ncbi:MAG TPA: signal peptidase II [bacterium]|nr:signal peptidase II [bacterium]
MSSRKTVIGLGIVCVGIADALFKYFALQYLPGEQTANLQSVFTLAIHKNPGIAFDLPIPLFIVLPITLGIASIFAYLGYIKWSSNTAQALGALAAVVGAIGNAADRLINNFTTDYIILFRTSAINLSDILIVIGILAVIWYDTRIPSAPTIK